jgi:hypothetical protein
MVDANESIGATARIFWAYEGFALAAALLAFPPDKAATYDRAIDDLRRLATIQIKADDVDQALISAAQSSVGSQVFDAVKTAAEAAKLTVAEGLAANSTYLLVDQGPQNLDFEGIKVAELVDIVAAYKDNPRYVIVAPDPKALRAALQTEFRGQNGVVTSFQIPCNYAPDRCLADVYVNPNGDVVGAQRDLEFFVPRVRVTLDYGVRDLIEAKYSNLKGTWSDVSAVNLVQADVGELAPAAAIAKLQELRKAEDHQLSVFDVSISGAMARFVAPLALAILAFAVWASASGLAMLQLDANEIDRSLFLPLIRTRPALVVRVAAFAFPIFVSVGLLLKAWPDGLIAIAISMVALIVQVLAGFAAFRIFVRLRASDTSTKSALY